MGTVDSYEALLDWGMICYFGLHSRPNDASRFCLSGFMFFFLPILVRSFIRTIVWQLGLVGVIYGPTMCVFFCP